MPDANANEGVLPVVNNLRWQAILNRDKAYDRKFVFGVKTTNIFCRSSCPSRVAKRCNVLFFQNCAEATSAGFRPCRRCRPDDIATDDRKAKCIRNACRDIANSGESLSLKALAGKSGLSPSHFHRVFKAATGLTPKKYGEACRAGRFREVVTQKSTTVTQAIYGSGFNSNSRFYESSDKIIGMTATSFKCGGKDTEIFFATGECSLGRILVGTTMHGICAMLFADTDGELEADLRSRFSNARITGGNGKLKEALCKIISSVEHPRLRLDMPLDLKGTNFQNRVWNALQTVPVGKTATYADIARSLISQRPARRWRKPVVHIMSQSRCRATELPRPANQFLDIGGVLTEKDVFSKGKNRHDVTRF
jgi:AraC family transcriptional regulator, regulatory protein of adaptative response / methylated-DNA-[protein]-cysteine methyltransferase